MVNNRRWTKSFEVFMYCISELLSIIFAHRRWFCMFKSYTVSKTEKNNKKQQQQWQIMSITVTTPTTRHVSNSKQNCSQRHRTLTVTIFPLHWGIFNHFFFTDIITDNDWAELVALLLVQLLSCYKVTQKCKVTIPIWKYIFSSQNIYKESEQNIKNM